MIKLVLSLGIVSILFSGLTAQKTVIGTVDYKYTMVGEGAEQMAGMMPKKMQIKYGENGVSIEMQGGAMSEAMGKTIVNGETGEAFIVRESERTVYLMSDEYIKAEAENLEDPVIREFDETKEILGYPCKKYTQTIKVQGNDMTQVLWITKKLVTPDYKSDEFMGLASQGTVNFDIEGFPMLIEVDMMGAPMTLQLEVSNIKFEKIPSSTFERPADYTVKDFSELKLF